MALSLAPLLLFQSVCSQSGESCCYKACKGTLYFFKLYIIVYLFSYRFWYATVRQYKQSMIVDRVTLLGVCDTCLRVPARAVLVVIIPIEKLILIDLVVIMSYCIRISETNRLLIWDHTVDIFGTILRRSSLGAFDVVLQLKFEFFTLVTCKIKGIPRWNFNFD